MVFFVIGHPKYRRHKRDDDVGGITYGPCKDTYSQCPEWKKSGMCDMPQYKDYMPLVCTDTCGFCKGKFTLQIFLLLISAYCAITGTILGGMTDYFLVFLLSHC